MTVSYFKAREQRSYVCAASSVFQKTVGPSDVEFIKDRIVSSQVQI